MIAEDAGDTAWKALVESVNRLRLPNLLIERLLPPDKLRGPEPVRQDVRILRGDRAIVRLPNERRDSPEIRPVRADVKFQLIGAIANTETIAAGPGIRVLAHLRKIYGPGGGADEKRCHGEPVLACLTRAHPLMR
jgi:hypothetical protein